MRKLALIATFVALSFAAMACSKEKPNGGPSNQTNQWEAEGTGTTVHLTDIDSTIVAFVNTHFPETSILSCNQTEHYFKVILNDNTKIHFTHAYEWVEVKSDYFFITGAVNGFFLGRFHFLLS